MELAALLLIAIVAIALMLLSIYALYYHFASRSYKMVGPPLMWVSDNYITTGTPLVVRKEIPLKLFVEDDNFLEAIQTNPDHFLRLWGLDPEKEVHFWDDKTRHVRVLAQELEPSCP